MNAQKEAESTNQQKREFTMKTLLALSIIAASFNAQALDIMNIGDMDKMDAKVIVGTASYHFKSENRKYLNERNPSIGFEVWDIQAIYVSKNSWEEKSVYLTYSPDYEINEYFTVSGQIGGATGYGCDNSVYMSKGMRFKTTDSCNQFGLMPIVAVSVEYSPFANGFNLSTSITPSVAMFSVSYDF